MFHSIISAKDFSELLQQKTDVLVFVCCPDLSNPLASHCYYGGQHILGARVLYLDVHLSGEIVAGRTGRHPLPEKADFLEKLAALGYHSQEQQVIIYDDKGGAYAARAWWMLKWLGHDKVAVLDGGLQAFIPIAPSAQLGKWEEEEQSIHATSTTSLVRGKDVQEIEPFTQFETNTSLAKIKSSPTVYDIEAVKRAQGKSDQLIIDSRSAPRYRGEEEPIDPVAGHVPTAINLPWTENLAPNGHFKTQAELKKRFAPLRDKASENIFYCGSGVTACHNILAYYHAFGELPSLYPGSWSEYLIYA